MDNVIFGIRNPLFPIEFLGPCDPITKEYIWQLSQVHSTQEIVYITGAPIEVVRAIIKRKRK